MHFNKERAIAFLRHNALLAISLSLAILAVLFGRFSLEFINFRVILILFGMMLVIAVFDYSNILKRLAIKLIDLSGNTRSLAQIIVGFSFLSSFFLSNDVTVLTVMPIYLRMLSYLPDFRGRILTAVLIPIAANMGGILFPFSNPQNLIIYNSFPISNKDFLSSTAPIMLLALAIFYLASFRVEKRRCLTNLDVVPANPSFVWQGSVSMLLMVLCVFELIPLSFALGVVLLAVILRKISLLVKVDYPLLLTFISFFLITGNVIEMQWVQTLVERFLSTPIATYFGSIVLSQLISNVPTTMLMQNFIESPKALLLGVNIGGIGTILASLTNVIAYRIFSEQRSKEKQRYLKAFLICNFALLILLSASFVVRVL